MKLSETLNDALNFQVLHEYRNQLIYKQIESFFEDIQLTKLARYFADASQQEKEHGDRFVNYINSRTGGKVSLMDINPPALQAGIDAIAVAFITTEEETTESIESLYDLALSEKSYVDLPFLQEMLFEQVEEEDKANKFAMQLKNCRDLVLFNNTFEG